MFKYFIRLLSGLFCGLIGVILCIILSLPATAWASPHAVTDDTPQTTPTSTAPNASVTLASPNGSPLQGRAGTQVQISGSGFQPGSEVNLYTTTDVGGCTVANAGGLAAFNTNPALTVKPDGSFQVTAGWPDNANQPGTAYYICAISPTSNSAAASSATFTIAQQPTITVSNPTANAGDTITVTGSNWLPAQALTVAITPGENATPIAGAQTSSGADGNFSVSIQIPATVQPGTYGISVVASNDPTLKAYSSAALTINVPATATPQATPSPATTAQPTPTPTPAATTGNGNSSGGGTSGMTLLIFGLGGLGIVLVIVGLTMYLSYSNAANTSSSNQ